MTSGVILVVAQTFGAADEFLKTSGWDVSVQSRSRATTQDGRNAISTQIDSTYGYLASEIIIVGDCIVPSNLFTRLASGGIIRTVTA